MPYKINENWLHIEYLELLKYSIGKATMFELLDGENNLSIEPKIL